jgi:hypothetical protein
VFPAWLAITEPAGFEVKITDGVVATAAVVEVEKRTVCITLVPIEPATGAVSVVTEIADVYTVCAVRPATAAVVDNIPIPKAATATSATRLKVVFVDICFLSISRSREFPPVGLGKKCLLICHERVFFTRFDESHVLIHQIPHRVSGRGEETYLFVFHLHRLR